MAGHDDVNRTGSMALDMHIHDVDFIRYLMEADPDRIQVQALKDGAGIVQYILSATYFYGDAILNAEASWDYPVTFPFAETFRVRFEKAAVLLDASGKLTVYPDEGEAFEPQKEEKEELDLGINISDIAPYRKEIRYFAERILSGEKESMVSLTEAVKSLELVKKEIDSIL